MSASLEILLESGPLLAVLKPAGVATQAPPGIDSMEARARAFLKERENKSGNIYLGVPHRLDRPVSGVLLFARHVRAARRISEQFEARLVRKTYWACVAGEVSPPEGEWRDYLKKVPDEARVVVAEADDADAREAVLRYRTRGATAWGSWLEIEPVTGRMHQIRVQAAARGWPVLGDMQYGSTIPFGPPCEDARQRAIALHGRSLELLHPMTKEPLRIVAPLPAAWEALGLADADAM